MDSAFDVYLQWQDTYSTASVFFHVVLQIDFKHAQLLFNNLIWVFEIITNTGYFFSDKYKLNKTQTVQHWLQISDQEHWYLIIIP